MRFGLLPMILGCVGGKGPLDRVIKLGFGVVGKQRSCFAGIFVSAS